MKKKKKSFVSGFLCGAVLFGASAAYAASVMAIPSVQSIYIDGIKAEITAYNIEGRNYVQLRELGDALSIPVLYDGKTNSVYIGAEPKNQIIKNDFDSKENPIGVNKPAVGDTIYGTGNISKAINPYASDEYDGVMIIKEYLPGVVYPEEPLGAINPNWDESHYEIQMPNPVPCYTHILAGETSMFMGMEVEGAKEVTEMYVFNPHETMRIVHALYEAFLDHPECYTAGKLNCTVHVGLTGSGFEGNFFYPYQEHCVTQTVGDRNTDYLVYAVDVFTDGVYMGTKYCCIQNCTPDNPDVISSDTAIMKDRQYK